MKFRDRTELSRPVSPAGGGGGLSTVGFLQKQQQQQHLVCGQPLITTGKGMHHRDHAECWIADSR